MKQRRCWCLIVMMVVLLPVAGFSQAGVRVSDFKFVPWFKAVKLVWKATVPEGLDGIFEIYRSDKEEGPYVLIREIRVGDKEFIDAVDKTYVFYDKKLKVARRYYYKMAVRGTDQVLGPLEGIASGAPPGT